MQTKPARENHTKSEAWCIAILFGVVAAFHFWGVTVGWQSRNLPANEFREAQTAISAYWIDREDNFSPAYPTPILGKPWSVPMEFPFYQWATVAVHRVTNWSLTKSGRAVSIACFYLTLPAVFLLLRRWQVPPTRRWLVLALVLTCPFYVYFTRAILIETMALMFSVWFWVAFERGVAERNKAWVALAIVAGTGAGLVKVTTYLLYLLPAGWWAFSRLWAKRTTDWRTEFWWMAAACAVPFAATLWWLHFADATKELNELGRAFTAVALRDFNLGTMETRFSAEYWKLKLGITATQLSWLPVMALCGAAAVTARRRGREIGACLLWFSAALLVFPVLYALHDYYYAANALLLLLAMGLALVALMESKVPRVLVAAVVLLAAGGQTFRYWEHYYPSQRAISDGGNGLTRLLETVVREDEVVVVLGQDWNSTTPYYARRRAIMLQNAVARDADRVERALANLEDTKIGALVIVGKRDGEQWLIDRCAARGLDSRPASSWGDARVFVRSARWSEATAAVLTHRFSDVTLAPGVEAPRHDVANRWVNYADIYPWEQMPFEGMTPRPARFFSQFGLGADSADGVMFFGAHPLTRLVFAVKAGAHTLRSSLRISPETYSAALRDDEVTDGVAISLFALGTGEEGRRLLATRYFDPRRNAEDRAPRCPLEFAFELPEDGEVELVFSSGPAGNLTRDWIQLGPLTIE